MTHDRAPAVGSGGPTDEKPSKSSGFWRIWEGLPPLIQALTPLIILLLGGAGGVAISHATTPAPQPTATVTVTVTATAPAPTSTPAPTGAALSVYWQGPVGITTNGLNFDTRPPSTTPTGDIVYDGQLVSNGTNIEFAVWPNSSTPNATQCQTYVTTHPSSSLLSINPGMQVCIKTDQGRFGLLSIGQVDSNNVVASAQATIWEM